MKGISLRDTEGDTLNQNWFVIISVPVDISGGLAEGARGRLGGVLTAVCKLIAHIVGLVCVCACGIYCG